MQAWVEDAQLLTDLRDLNRNITKTLQRTESVNNFLADHRNQSAALVAPKGFGKTFLLKLKRVLLQDSHLCLPRSPIVDRPQGAPPILSAEIIDILETSTNWEVLWQIAFSISVMKSIRNDDEISEYLEIIKANFERNITLKSVIDNPHKENPFDILHNCLTSTRTEFFSMIKNYSDFTSYFSKIHKPIAVFIDNIDEYLENYINYHYTKNDNLHEKYLRLWHNGQIGAWLAIRRLHGLNPHVKIYVSVRKEAYHYAMKNEPLFANLRAFSHTLEYNRDDIVQIIEKNIKSEPDSKLSDTTIDDPLIRFTGKNTEFVSNSGTGRQELLLEYWLRHCTHRPRDSVMIGGEISAIHPQARNRQTIRATINRVAAERVQNLFTEVLPFFDGLYPDLFPAIIPSNVLTLQDIENASQEYKKLAVERYSASAPSICHPFCALYSIGLIGVVQEDRDQLGSFIQKFSPIGEVPFGSINVIPKADLYLIHPSLSDYIVGRDVSFLQKMNKHNVVGDGLEWRATNEERFVLAGDMKNYRSTIMNNVGASQTFELYWRDLLRRSSKSLDYFQESGGDHFVLVDRSPLRVLSAAVSIKRQLKSSPYNMEVRIGGHCGLWKIRHDADGLAHAEISDILGVAARIEPISKPGDILVTEEFLTKATQFGISFGDPVKMVDSGYLEEIKRLKKDGSINISALDQEIEECFNLYILDNNLKL